MVIQDRRRQPIAGGDPEHVAPSPFEAARTLASLGFLVRSDLPDRPGPAVLLVALRDAPAETHYDPERISYWVNRGGIGRRAELTRRSPMPIVGEDFAWGEIRIADRFHVTNAYLSFGGRLSAAFVKGGAVAVFESPVPLLRRGGHSQGWDAAAEQVGAFFGRVRVAVDYASGFEERFGDAGPEARYAAFIADAMDRFRAEPARRHAQSPLSTLLATEERRLATLRPDAVRAGDALLEEIRAV